MAHARTLLARGGLHTAAGAYDVLSARLVRHADLPGWDQALACIERYRTRDSA